MSESSNLKFARLLGKLLEGTEAGLLNWEELTQTSFLLPSSTGGVIVESVDEDGRIPFAVRIMNTDGTIVETILSHSGGGGAAYHPTPEAELVEALYDVARRNALNIDRLLDSLLGEIDSRIRRPGRA